MEPAHTTTNSLPVSTAMTLSAPAPAAAQRNSIPSLGGVDDDDDDDDSTARKRKILILASLTPATGNEATVRRLDSLLRGKGFATELMDCNKVSCQCLGWVVVMHHPPLPSPHTLLFSYPALTRSLCASPYRYRFTSSFFCSPPLQKLRKQLLT
jgi:hypothetical protein